MKRFWIPLFSLIIVSSVISCQAKPTNYPAEVGPAKFHRDFDTASKLSKESGKPIFAFFQEVPG